MGDVQEEFLAEAQEIIETLSRDLLMLDQAQKEGGAQPDLINEIFRAVHTLKGIAGMFGYHKLGALAHSLEDLLDALRLGRVSLTQDVLDILFEGVEGFQRLLSDSPDIGQFDVERFALSLGELAAPKPAPEDELEDYELDPSVLAVLTEYEEHRLRTNVAQGVPLFRLQVRFSLSTIDTHLEDLKNRAKPLAEIITYLPSAGGGDGDLIDLDVILASGVPYDELRSTLCEGDAELLTVPRRRKRQPVSLPPRTDATELQPPPVPHLPPPIPDAVLAPKEMTADQLSLRSVANTVRVDIRKLDHLMNVVGELALVRTAVVRMTDHIRELPEFRKMAAELHRINRGFERHLEELQDGILDVRMVPLGQVFDKLARVVRQVAREHDKEVRLIITGAETEVDKLIVEELSDPLMHLIRNAIDHGLESPKVRELADKPPTGTLVLNAYQKGNHVVIEIEDDGSGMNERLLLETAVRKGLITIEAAEDFSREDALELIFEPGFSTRSSITDISGRGMGMDVVKTNISRLGGIIDVQSEVGGGTKFTITLPVTLAIISALLMRVADRSYAMPIASVQEAIRLNPNDIRTIEGREVLSLRGSTLPLCRLARFFDLPDGHDDKRFVIVSAVGSRRIGFVVDALEGQRDIIIKALGKSLSSVSGFAGATDLGDQRVALVLDAGALLDATHKAASRELQ